MEALKQLSITYKLTGGGKDAWEDVQILLTGSKPSKQHHKKTVNRSVTNNENEILKFKKQIQLLKQEKSTFETLVKRLQSLKQLVPEFQFQIKERDSQITLLTKDFQLLQHKNTTFHNQIKTSDSKITSLQSENQELKLKVSNLEHEVREKNSKITLVQSEN
jgi:chromosome segregation ATPase